MVRALELSFAPPAPELAPYVSAYYHVYFDYPLIEDFERADVGYLRFMFGGHGFYHYPGGRRMPDRPVMLLGPASIAVGYSMAGPLNSFGCVLLPEFWGGIVDASACDYANDARDGVPLLGEESLDLYRRMNGMRDVIAMGQMMDAFLLPRIKPLPDDHRAIIGKIGDWLSCMPIPAPAALYDSLGENVKITLIATGYDVSDIPGMPKDAIKTEKSTQTEPSGPKVLHSMVSALKGNTNEEPLKDDITKAMDQYYHNQVKPADNHDLFSASVATASKPQEQEMDELDLDDLEDDTKLKKVENIPAWKRKFLRQ